MEGDCIFSYHREVIRCSDFCKSKNHLSVHNELRFIFTRLVKTIFGVEFCGRTTLKDLDSNTLRSEYFNKVIKYISANIFLSVKKLTKYFFSEIIVVII